MGFGGNKEILDIAEVTLEPVDAGVKYNTILSFSPEVVYPSRDSIVVSDRNKGCGI